LASVSGSRAVRPVRAASVLTAYVLHRYDWSESSVVLDLFTRELGRLPVVAKGAKRPYSQLRPVLLPFQRLLVTLGKPPKSDDSGDPDAGGDVRILRTAEWAGGAAMLTGAALFSGFYLNELLMKLLGRQDTHPDLFDAYAATLPSLASADDVVAQSALRAFELTLMLRLGVLPDLTVVTSTQESVALDRGYALVPEAGLSHARPSDTPISGAAWVDLQAALIHGSVPALQLACGRVLPALRAQVRTLLHYHLGTHVLRTRQVMIGVQSLG
jgi:DNA repair protein RecO (recombination protein O)